MNNNSNVNVQGRLVRYLSSEPASGEVVLVNILRRRFPKAKTLEVEDISGISNPALLYESLQSLSLIFHSSGGCGSMYAVFVESSEFAGLSTVKQHRLITETLKAEIKEMHGLRIQTAVPP